MKRKSNMTNITKIIKRTVITVFSSLALTAVTLYLLASWIPSGYKPAQLTEGRKDMVMKDFFIQVQEFGNNAQSEETFSISFTEKQINEYMASMDAIATLRPNVKHGAVYRIMDKVGLAEPAVVLLDGVMTIMVRTRRYEKVLSAGLTFDFVEDGRLKIGLSGAYVGRAPVPEAIIRDRLAVLKVLLRRQMDKVRATTKPIKRAAMIGFSTRDIARIIRAAITAIDEAPIGIEDLTGKVNKAHIRITDIDIADGRITMHFKRVEKDRKREG